MTRRSTPRIESTSRGSRVTTLGALAIALTACRDATAPNGNVVLGRRIIAGEQVACALTRTGAVYCWGFNSTFWEYGASPSVVRGGRAPAATDIPPLASLAKGVGTHFCGLSTGGDGVCWARGDVGQLGGGFVVGPGNPAGTVSGGIHWTDIAVGRLTTCGLSDAGAAYCWGANQLGTVGSASVGVAAFVSTPTAVDGGHTFKTITAGWVHACGITTDGATLCWGGNNTGQLGVGTVDSVAHATPVAVSGGLTFTQLSLGTRYSCALTAEGDAYCWGGNGTGQLGDGTLTDRSAPTPVLGGLKFTQIVASSGFSNGSAVAPPIPLQGGVGHTCALATDGRAYCWGWNGNGQLGDGTMLDRLAPTLVSGDRAFTTLALGGAYACGMQGDDVWCWGSNANGQLGTGDTEAFALTPKLVRAPFGSP